MGYYREGPMVLQTLGHESGQTSTQGAHQGQPVYEMFG